MRRDLLDPQVPPDPPDRLVRKDRLVPLDPPERRDPRVCKGPLVRRERRGLPEPPALPVPQGRPDRTVHRGLRDPRVRRDPPGRQAVASWSSTPPELRSVRSFPRRPPMALSPSWRTSATISLS